MPGPKGSGMGMRRMGEFLKREFPGLEFGYFNQPVRGLMINDS
jgi:hypothetical protein